MPGWLNRWVETGVEEREDRKPNTHLLADRVATMCWLGNQAAFEIHAWTSKKEDPWRPTFALVDIDPGDKTTWEETVTLARLYRTAFEHLGVRAYPKLTGKRGIQAWIPVVPGKYEYSDTSAWVEKVSKAVGAMVPDLVSWEWAKAGRKGRARLDYTQNASIKTLVAPYAVRPAAGAPVSAPITWEELDDPDLRPNRWTIRDVVERVEQVGDLFARRPDGPAGTAEGLAGAGASRSRPPTSPSRARDDRARRGGAARRCRPGGRPRHSPTQAGSPPLRWAARPSPSRSPSERRRRRRPGRPRPAGP